MLVKGLNMTKTTITFAYIVRGHSAHVCIIRGQCRTKQERNNGVSPMPWQQVYENSNVDNNKRYSPKWLALQLKVKLRHAPDNRWHTSIMATYLYYTYVYGFVCTIELNPHDHDHKHPLDRCALLLNIQHSVQNIAPRRSTIRII